MNPPYVCFFPLYNSLAPGAKMELCYPIEIYSVVGKAVYLIHQRSLCKKGKKFPFCREFLGLIESMCPLSEGRY